MKTSSYAMGILACAIASMATATVFAEVRPYESETLGGPEKTYSNRPVFEGFVTRNGYVFGVANGKTYLLNDAITLSNNLRIDANGTVTDGNGRVTHISEDQMVTPDGRVESTPLGIDTREAIKDYSIGRD